MNGLFQEKEHEVEPEDSMSDENGLALKLAKMLVTLLDNKTPPEKPVDEDSEEMM